MDGFASTNLLPEVFLASRTDIKQEFSLILARIKTGLIVPFLKAAITVCLVMSTMMLMEMVYLAVVLLLVKLFGKKPEKRYKWEPLNDDLEMGNSSYPMVLVQIPMYNEREVYRLSIGAACCFSWPSDRILIQVLDDSTDPVVKALVEAECQRWASKGVNIKYEARDHRNGYKAGALNDGLKHPYVKECHYVAIFDADFQPEPDFLWQTVPFLIHNSQLALVQARCKFVNSDECLMTRMQEMSLNCHFTVEQEVGSSTYAFFGFNGTAGVWRLSAIDDAGGWIDRTTVEDMDLAVRAGLKGWKFVYLASVKVKNELPSTFKAYRYQQHRWSCGPANLFRKMLVEIIRNNKVALWKKLHVIYSFFFVRKIITHVITFVFYCIVLPATVFVPEVQVPKWGTDYLQVSIFLVVSVLVVASTPRLKDMDTWHSCMLGAFHNVLRSLHLLIVWIIFENVMSLHRTKAVLVGLLESSRAKEWVVTEKLGDALKVKPAGKPIKRWRFKIRDRLHLLELGAAAYLSLCGCYDFAFGKNRYYIYLFIQGIAFLIVGFGYIGIVVPNGTLER